MPCFVQNVRYICEYEMLMNIISSHLIFFVKNLFRAKKNFLSKDRKKYTDTNFCWSIIKKRNRKEKRVYYKDPKSKFTWWSNFFCACLILLVLCPEFFFFLNITIYKHQRLSPLIDIRHTTSTNIFFIFFF